MAVKRFKGALLDGRFDISNELEVLKLCRCGWLRVGCPQPLWKHATVARETTNPSKSCCACVHGSLFTVFCGGLKVVHVSGGSACYRLMAPSQRAGLA